MTTRLEGLRARFLEEPGNIAAFDALEEAHFLAGEWSELVALYEQRLTAPDLAPDTHAAARARLLLRMAQVLEERCLDADAALRCFEQAAALEPDHRLPLVQIRRLHGQREHWDRYLEAAQREAQLPMRASEQAAFHTDLGRVWLDRLGDAQQAVGQFELALEADPGHAEALLGLAAAEERLQAPERAAHALSRAVERLRGTERAPALVALGRLYAGPLEEPERARQAYQRALSDDPTSPEALEAVAAQAAQSGEWNLYDDLQERRFQVAKDAVRKLAVAHEAGRACLEERNHAKSARFWFERALELFPDDPVVHLYLADVERLSDNAQAVGEHLRRAAELAEDAAPTELLQESADHARREGDEAFAVEQLKRALRRAPTDEKLRAELVSSLERIGRLGEIDDLLVEDARRVDLDVQTQLSLWLRVGTHREERLGDVIGACEAYRSAFELDPGSVAAGLALGRCLASAASWQELRDMHRRVAEHSGSAPSQRVASWCEIGDLSLARLDDPTTARQAFESALGLDPECVRAREGLARVALELGEPDAVLESFEREAEVTSDRERLGFLLVELARIHESRDRLDRALYWVERWVQVFPESPTALETQARLQQALGRSEALAHTLERLDPLLTGEAQVKNRERLAALRRAQGEPSLAIQATRAVLEARPDDVEALLDLDELLARSAARPELVLVRTNLAGLLDGAAHWDCVRELAQLHFERRDLPAAIDCWTELLEAGEAEPGTDLLLEQQLAALGRWEELCTRLEVRRQQLDPEDPQGIALDLDRAQLLLDRLEQPELAIELFDRVREVDPHSKRAREGLETALRRTSRHDRLAALLAERAREEECAEHRAALELERATLLEEALRRIPEALRVLTDVADGDSSLAQEAEGRLRSILERTEDWATLRLRRLRELGGDDAPQDLVVHLELADLSLERLEDRTAAIGHLEEAARIDPSRAATWQRLAALYQRAGDPEGCLRAVEAELETGPDPDRTRLLRARAGELAQDGLADAQRAEHHFRALLELDPHNARAAEFLIRSYEETQRYEQLGGLLRTQLEGTEHEPRAETSLRLRIAALEAGPLGRPEEAIAVLEPCLQHDASLPLVAEPLADLYERAGRGEALLALARRAVACCEAGEERAGWSLRVGDALRKAGDDAGAADAYRRALADRPDDRGAEAALREVHRRLGEAAPLARLLEAELARVGGAAEIPLRLELAELLRDRLDRPDDALPHLRRVLQLEPAHVPALRQALDLARELERDPEALELLGCLLEQTRAPADRAALLSQRATLLADRLGRPAEALEDLRRSLDLQPHEPERRTRLRRLLEACEDWPGVLAWIDEEVARLPESRRDDRRALLEEAADLAAEQLGAEAALPWLVRLRALDPLDARILARIAELHRRCGRTDALLRTLAEEIETGPEPERRAALELERARLFEEQLDAPGCAISALEAARRARPGARETLVALERLYARTGRARERAEILAELVGQSAEGERARWLRVAAEVARQRGALAEAADLLWRALPDTVEGIDRIETLQELEALLPRLGRRDLWARVAEAELASLDPAAPVFSERRGELRRVLAEAYRCELGRPDRAREHLERLLDAEAEALEPAERARAEDALLGLLRRADDVVELERRLSRRLEMPGQQAEAGLWLELARLRHERLHRLEAAAEAYRRALDATPGDLEALRGLRVCAARLGRPAEVADTLERELALRPDASGPERAAMHRALGEIAWRQLDATPRASQAFAAALEADPRDRISLHSLQQLFETMEDWRGAADLYESEISLLGDAEPDRRQDLWLRVGRIARDRLEDRTRALGAFEQAGDLSPLPLEARREWALLLEAEGRIDRFVAVFASWVDAEGSGASAADQLRLARAWESAGDVEHALARLERAVARAPDCIEAWDAMARLHEKLGHGDEAARCHERAAGCAVGSEAAQRRLAAARLVDAAEEQVRLLERSLADDPASAEVHARLALAACELGRTGQAERAALRAAELAAGTELDSELQREAFLAGARAARERGHADEAVSLLEAVLRIAPDDTDALASHGELALTLGDASRALPSLERCVTLDGAHPDRALHLAWLGRALQAVGREEPALGHFERALALDPRLDDAHRGRTELLQRSGRIDEAVDALQTWAARTQEPQLRAERLMQAARLELDRPGREEPAEALLREAVAAQSDHEEAWTLLCGQLWSQRRTTEALHEATRALEACGPEGAPPALSLIRGRALEERGDHRAAADAFREAARLDPRGSEAALSAARLLRALGEWREAALVLREFVERAPDDLRAQLAPAWHQLGRLLAGPLEDVEGAIHAYRQAIEADPELREARHALADILVHRSEHWDDAVRRHLELLSEEPTRLASLRGLVRIARGRDEDRALRTGLAILRALGCATPEERLEAPARLPGLLQGTGLSDPIGEALRRLGKELAEEIGEALGAGSAGDGPPAQPGADPVARLRSALVSAEGVLCAPALVPLADEELGRTLALTAELVLESESVQGDGDLVNALSSAIGRRARRRARKGLGALGPGDLRQVDWPAWRRELRSHAALQALEAVDGELRTAFLAWLEETDGAGGRALPPECDLRDRVADCPQARLFLQRLIEHWSRCL